MSLILDGTNGLSDVDGTAAAPAIRGTDTNTGIFFPAADTIAFAEGGAEAARFDSAGNMGLGATPSAWGSNNRTIDMYGIGSFSSFSNGSGGYELDVGLNAYNSASGWRYKVSSYAVALYQQAAGSHIWYNAAAGTAGNAISFTQAMTLDSSGNVGIGTSSPNYLATLYKASLPILQLANSTSGSTAADGLLIYLNGANATISNEESGSLIFQTSGTERARIDSSGNLMVGTTSAIARITVDIAGAPSGEGIAVKAASAGNFAMDFRASSGSTVGSIVLNASTTTYNTSSDYRLKNTITPMTGALAKVALLRPVTYKWNVDEADGQGFIAHELAEVVPDCVTGEKDAVREEQYEVTPAVKDEEGRVITEAVMGTRTVPSYQGIDTSFLVATLTAAIQELHALVKTQDSTITALTTRITALEGAAA